MTTRASLLLINWAQSLKVYVIQMTACCCSSNFVCLFKLLYGSSSSMYGSKCHVVEILVWFKVSCDGKQVCEMQFA